jgi:hypothetical protein
MLEMLLALSNDKHHQDDRVLAKLFTHILWLLTGLAIL